MKRILRPLLGELNQGQIFCCATAERYADCPVFGIVITARCDLAQDKFPILNYLPIVPLDHWLRVDGYDILHSRAVAENHSAIEQTLENAGIATSILNSQTLENLATDVFQDSGAEKKVKSQARRFQELVTRMVELNRLASPAGNPCELFDLVEKHGKALVRELTQNRLNGYYFIPDVYDDGDQGGYVVLLREVKHMPRAIAVQLAMGLDPNDRTLADATAWKAYLSFDHERFAMPTGELPSPEVEHLLQAFSTLFVRVGITDLPKNYIDKLSLRRPAALDNRS